MNAAEKQIISPMEIFGRIDSTLRQVENEEQALAWKPSPGREREAFDALISLENRPALKKWYASGLSINPHADRFRRMLEWATGDSLPVGTID